MTLPIYQSQSKDMSLMQTGWAAQLNPVINNELINGLQIVGVSLVVGATTFNHLLGRQMIGWIITDMNAPATIYRSQPLNSKTLTLTSNAVCSINLWVF